MATILIGGERRDAKRYFEMINNRARVMRKACKPSKVGGSDGQMVLPYCKELEGKV